MALLTQGSEPASNWMQPGFDATNWAEGQGGFGYGDNDDNTIIRRNNCRLY